MRLSPSSPFNLEENPDGVLIVSNTAGSDPKYPVYENEAREMEERLQELRIPVFRAGSSSSSIGGGGGQSQGHSRPFKKPFSYHSILTYLYARNVIQHPNEVAVVGDRLGTDVLMASLMGAWSVWIREGVTVNIGKDGNGINVGSENANEGTADYRGFLAKREVDLERYLKRRGVKPAMPEGWEGIDL